MPAHWPRPSVIDTVVQLWRLTRAHAHHMHVYAHPTWASQQKSTRVPPPSPFSPHHARAFFSSVDERLHRRHENEPVAAAGGEHEGHPTPVVLGGELAHNLTTRPCNKKARGAHAVSPCSSDGGVRMSESGGTQDCARMIFFIVGNVYSFASSQLRTHRTSPFMLFRELGTVLGTVAFAAFAAFEGELRSRALLVFTKALSVPARS